MDHDRIRGNDATIAWPVALLVGLLAAVDVRSGIAGVTTVVGGAMHAVVWEKGRGGR